MQCWRYTDASLSGTGAGQGAGAGGGLEAGQRRVSLSVSFRHEQ